MIFCSRIEDHPRRELDFIYKSIGSSSETLDTSLSLCRNIMNANTRKQKLDQLFQGHKTLYRHITYNGKLYNPYSRKNKKINDDQGMNKYENGSFVTKTPNGYTWASWTVWEGNIVTNFSAVLDSNGTVLTGSINYFSLGMGGISQEYVDEYIKVTCESAAKSNGSYWHYVDVTYDQLKNMDDANTK